MDTFLELQEAVQSDLNVDSGSTFYTLTQVKLAINRAYRKTGGLFPWPELQDAKKTSTQVNQEYYDYPTNWRSNSIWKLTILDSDGNDDRYGEDPDGSPLSFDDYLVWKEDNPDSTEKKWANQWRRFFIWPVPTTAVTNNIHVWGIKVITTLSADDHTTIFTYSTPEANEAIVLEAVAILKAKGEQENSSKFRSDEAKQILANACDKIKKEMTKYEKNQPFFEVTDMFGTGSSKDLRGRFDI